MKELKSALKQKIVAHLLAEKQASYDNMMAIQQSEMADVGEGGQDERGMFDDGKTGQQLNRVEARSSVLDALQEEINLLNGLGSINENEEIQLGDVIETDRGNFFAAVPADEFEIDGKAYRGISTKSPLFQALMGKRDGDEVVVNGNAFKLIHSF